MKINLTPIKKLAMLTMVFCAVMFTFSQNASADTILGFLPGDTHVVGTVTPVSPANPSDQVDYINFMIALLPGTSGDFHNPPHTNHITRSNNLFASLPTAGPPGSVSGGGTSIDLNTRGTFTYLFAKYDGQNDTSVVWNISGLTGMLTIPLNGPLGYGLSGWVLFNPTGTGVPDGGSAVMLLGAALGALGMARRFLKK